MRTLTAYGIGVAIVLALLNGMAWEAGTPAYSGLNSPGDQPAFASVVVGEDTSMEAYITRRWPSGSIKPCGVALSDETPSTLNTSRVTATSLPRTLELSPRVTNRCAQRSRMHLERCLSLDG